MRRKKTSIWWLSSMAGGCDLPEPDASGHPLGWKGACEDADRSKKTADLISRLNQLNRSKKIGLSPSVARMKRDDHPCPGSRQPPVLGTRVSVEKAMEKLGGEGQGIVYFTVRDKKGMPLGNAGELPPERKKEDPLFPKIPCRSRDVREPEGELRWEEPVGDRCTPASGRRDAGIVRLGLERGNTDQILAENRRNMFVFLAFVS